MDYQNNQPPQKRPPEPAISPPYICVHLWNCHIMDLGVPFGRTVSLSSLIRNSSSFVFEIYWAIFLVFPAAKEPNRDPRLIRLLGSTSKQKDQQLPKSPGASKSNSRWQGEDTDDDYDQEDVKFNDDEEEEKCFKVHYVWRG